MEPYPQNEYFHPNPSLMSKLEMPPLAKSFGLDCEGVMNWAGVENAAATLATTTTTTTIARTITTTTN